jgi:hypothetical protein
MILPTMSLLTRASVLAVVFAEGRSANDNVKPKKLNRKASTRRRFAVRL